MDTNDKAFPRWLYGHAQEIGFGETAEPVYEWEHCVPRKVRDLDDVCVALGNGNGYIGLKIVQALVAHVEHADEAHPWPEGVDERHAMHVIRSEYAEAQEQYDYCKLYGMLDDDAPHADADKLAEARDHYFYELLDTMAPMVKALRMQY